MLREDFRRSLYFEEISHIEEFLTQYNINGEQDELGCVSFSKLKFLGDNYFWGLKFPVCKTVFESSFQFVRILLTQILRR
jgi:hypothetical protein